jgi:DNA topoisomerase VI subunit B
MKQIFDLNINTILTNWSVSQAIRELIANALDEQILTQTSAVRIVLTASGKIVIQDYGRGIMPQHLTLSESSEKRRCSKMIGQFGIGLKDAIATLYHNNYTTTIISAHGYYTFEKRPKHNFNNICTLHAIIDEADGNYCASGTTIIIGTGDTSKINTMSAVLTQAKNYFTKYNPIKLLHSNTFGEIYARDTTGIEKE